jgi:FdhD protein
MSGVVTETLGLLRLTPGDPGPVRRDLAVEQPIALEYNGVSFAVMMGTPVDLVDFATGFTLSEGLVATAQDIQDLAVAEVAGAHIIRITLPSLCAAPLLDRVRLRVGEGSCGLCGIESIAEVLRPLPPLTVRTTATPTAVARALRDLGAHQPLGQRTGAMHAAAFCDNDGAIVTVREDVGRHNALDKLVGALARSGHDPARGFILLSARCSYELVEKTVRAGCPLLVTISAPTSLAADRARDSGLTLLALARHDSVLVVNDPHGRFGAEAAQ